ncbi:unnamed protein product [Symbiodinium natans]|uniref:BTB domain-containing protein n=1 Tax=Symbiodinium natans TaxID=878477 RepID=A0A812MWL3_9DINO|nr:unnamed protein product [Symbiodinium natans]
MRLSLRRSFHGLKLRILQEQCSPHWAPILHAAILDGVTRPEIHKTILDILTWLLRMGADPKQEAPAGAHNFDIWKTNQREETTVNVNLVGHTALSLTLALHEALWGVDWQVERSFLESVVSVISTPPRASEKVTINPGVLDRWEAVLEMTDTHNVTFETADGEVTAHDMVLAAASPVLKAMLESCMVEGVQKRIKVLNDPSSGVSLFLDMLYTNATRRNPDHQTTLVALDLAHRWQVENVVQVLADVLQDMIGVHSFIDITEAAVLKKLQSLERACVSFGTKSSKIQAMLQKGSLPPLVCKLLGNSEANKESAKKKRKVY